MDVIKSAIGGGRRPDRHEPSAGDCVGSVAAVRVWRAAIGCVVCLAGVGCRAGSDPVVVRTAQTETSVASSTSTSVATSTATSIATSTSAPDPVAGTVPELPADSGPSGPAGEPQPAWGGDDRFPDLGSGELDVGHYGVSLDYDPDRRLLVGSVEVTGTLIAAADQVRLDLNGPTVTAAAIDGVPSDYLVDRRDVIVELGDLRPAGSEFSVTVEYVLDVGDQNFFRGDAGLFPTPDGLWAVNEPDGASTWLPVNDHPTDKAAWSFAITVPTGLTAIANGALVTTSENVSTTTWTWEQSEPMATYLVLLLVGEYEFVDDGLSSSGVQLEHVVLARERDVIESYLAVTRDQLEFFESLFGPYPFERYGVAITDSVSGLAMETQGLSLFSSAQLNGDLGRLQQAFLSHELAHQWFGDAVSPATWNDIWLNEGLATYAEWLWFDELGLAEIGDRARQTLAVLPVSGWPLDEPAELFGPVVYDGGAVVLHALRIVVGDDAFFTGLADWVATYLDDSASTDQFRAVMEAASGRDLREFFETWVSADSIPGQLPG